VILRGRPAGGDFQSGAGGECAAGPHFMGTRVSRYNDRRRRGARLSPFRGEASGRGGEEDFTVDGRVAGIWHQPRPYYYDRGGWQFDCAVPGMCGLMSM